MSETAQEMDGAALEEALRIAEALVFASEKPVTLQMLAGVLPEELPAAAVLEALAARYAGRGVELQDVAGGWAFRTAPDLAPKLTRVIEAPRRLPRAAMEALAIIAYHQPCTRGEIEEIRGTALSQTSLEALLELGLIQPRGRRETPGRPALWGTTDKFLAQFSLRQLGDLPKREELVTAETGPALPLPEPRTSAPEPSGPETPEADTPEAELGGSETPEPEKDIP
ncbi:SMC-Scp complex subunit ScpB [Plastoroseomonas hellenica]|uniref:SMC-Scp complex subunit ScpB n=1 Tax=Plastoroseomonas hellenica TaxID=2687306 RepID=UPI001BA65115|nr:SMC-Scp complex subunit ScpB [Plastoroseomonas hellenica]MBR0647728.1 SMC-Scp complex subunit ScpB [Plastoroseomonas hellenica]